MGQGNRVRNESHSINVVNQIVILQLFCEHSGKIEFLVFPGTLVCSFLDKQLSPLQTLPAVLLVIYLMNALCWNMWYEVILVANELSEK